MAIGGPWDSGAKCDICPDCGGQMSEHLAGITECSPPSTLAYPYQTPDSGGTSDPLKVAGDTGGMTLEGLAAELMHAGEDSENLPVEVRTGKVSGGVVKKPVPDSAMVAMSDGKIVVSERETVKFWTGKAEGGIPCARVEDDGSLIPDGKGGFVSVTPDELRAEGLASRTGDDSEDMPANLREGGEAEIAWLKAENEALKAELARIKRSRDAHKKLSLGLAKGLAKEKGYRFKPTPSEQLSRAFEASVPSFDPKLGAKDWQAK